MKNTVKEALLWIVSNVDRICTVVASVLSVVISIVALHSVNLVINRDDATSLLLEGESAYNKGDYELAYEKFSSSLLYDSAIAKLYLGYMNSNGLGCERNILLGSAQYQKAVDMGYDGCAANLLYNTLNF